jgi:hypothetical protein
LADENGGRKHAGFLPPEPSGPEPDLESQPADVKPEPEVSPRGFDPPAEHEAHASASQEYPPAAQQLGWNAPPPPATPGQLQPGGYVVQPDNGQAVAGLSLSIASAVLLVLSVGISTIVSIVCAGFGIHYSRKGRARVDSGETTRNRGVAQAGFVTGIVALVLSILCTIGWIAFVVLFATDEEFRQDLKDELDDGDGDPPKGFETSVRLTAAAVRLVGALVR